MLLGLTPSCLVLLFTGLILNDVSGETFGQGELMYEWTSVDLDWQSSCQKSQAIKNGSYVPERNIISGIKVYNNEVYLTIPRWQFTSGIPATLVKVVIVNGQVKLRPYPTWAAQEQGNCLALQFVQSMEIDPNTGLMYVIDTGRIGITGSVTSLNLCPPKIVVYDLNSDREVQRHILPSDVVSWDNNFMNDIILDYVDGKVKYAYISDPSQALMHVYNFETRQGHNVDDPSMKSGTGNNSLLTINGKQYKFPGALNGIAMSPDFDYVYYCPLGGYNLYQVPTSDLRQKVLGNNKNIRSLGRKVSQSGGIIQGRKQLYFGALALNGVYYWDIKTDMEEQNLGIDKVMMKTQRKLVTNNQTMQWPDSFAVDEHGWLWWVSNRLQIFFGGDMDFSGNDGINMRVWKVFVNETSYLSGADQRTAEGPVIG